MINRITILLIVIAPAFAAFGQDTAKSNNKSLSLQLGYANLLNGIMISPAYGWEHTKSHFYIGPTLFLALGDNTTTSKGFALTGIQGSYQYFTTKNESKVNFHLQGDLILQRRKEEGSSSIFNAQTSSFDTFDYKIINNYIQLYLGYGLRLNLSKGMFLTQSIGIGPSFTLVKTESDFDTFSDKFIDVDWLVKIGFTKVLNSR